MSPASFTPTFLLLGAAKAGTTSLHEWLDQHPAIAMSNPKEPFFFEAEYERGTDWYRERYFAHLRDQPVTGDSRHRNLYLPYVPARVLETAPDARFVAILREPAGRAHSHWWHETSLGNESQTFEEAVASDLARIEAGERIETPAEIAHYARELTPHGVGPHSTYLDSGYYHEQLERWLELFPRERFLILLHDELVADPRRVLRRTFEHLDVDPSPADEIDVATRNPAKPVPMRRALRWSARNVAKRVAQGELPKVSRAVVPRQRPRIAEETRTWLADHFAPHNRRLRQLTGLALERWS